MAFADQSEQLSLHVGQAGVGMGLACWTQFSTEHGLNSTGHRREEATKLQMPVPPANFYRETEGGRFVPRALYMDLDPASKAKVIKSGLYETDQTVVGGTHASGLYAAGYYSAGKEHLEQSMEMVRYQMEQSGTTTRTCYIYRALGGGTGAGFGALLTERLAQEYPELVLVEVATYPSPTRSPNFCDPYNTTLALHTELEFTNTSASFLFHEDRLHTICQERARIESPKLHHLNSLIAKVVSSLTFQRFAGARVMSAENDLGIVDLAPFPRVHFPVLSYTPLKVIEGHSPGGENGNTNDDDDLSSTILSGDLLNPQNAFLPLDLEERRNDNRDAETLLTYGSELMSYSAFYRGSTITSNNLAAYASGLRWGLSAPVPTWCPGGSKVSGLALPVCSAPGDIFGQYAPPQTGTLCANTTRVAPLWEQLGDMFDRLHSKRAFVHWYLQEGMDEDEFLDSREGLRQLVDDYAVIAEVGGSAIGNENWESQLPPRLKKAPGSNGSPT